MSPSPLNRIAAASALALAMGGCLGSAATYGNDAGVNTDGFAAEPDMAVDVKGDFAKNVQGLLIGDCGGCHSTKNGSYPGFLAADPDVYTTFTSYPGLVGATPDTSRILLKDVHVGPSYHASGSYTPSATLQAHAKIISDWIVEYNAAGGKTTAASDMGVKSTVAPFAPVMNQTNSVNLGEIDAQFLGMTLTFTPTLLGSTGVKLSGMTITGTSSLGVHIKSPVFARYAASAPTVAIDVDYDYLNYDLVAYAGTPGLFDPDLTIFEGYQAGQLIGITFTTIETTMASPDMGMAVGSCKDLTAYNAFKPRLTTAQTGMNNACASGGCHGQANGIGGFNLNGIATAANDADICANVLLNTVQATPDQSPIYKHITDGTGHGGGQLDPSVQPAYLTDLTTFINAQK